MRPITVPERLGNLKAIHGGKVEDARKPNAYLWKKIGSHARGSSLGWIPWAEFLNIGEYDRGDLIKEGLVMI